MIIPPDILSPLKGSRGMTLLEIMLALLVLAMVVAMVALSLSGSLNVVSETRKQGELYHQAQVALERISDDLASAVMVNDVRFQGKRMAIDGRRADSLRFASMAHIVFDPKHDHPGMAIISYTVRPDPRNSGDLVLLRADRLLTPPAGQDGNGEGDEGFLLCNGLRSVRFSFTDKSGETFDSWGASPEDEKDMTPRRLPVTVTCTLEFRLDRDQNTSLTFSTSVLLPVGLIQAERGGGGGS
ncbi:MAG: type II secretion system protein [Deltaproteobacteria bacterium]|nr:type II secretion system protein [Deltaproteobacteria bacterium]